MIITLEVPDSFNAMGITMVFGENQYALKMYSATVTLEDLGEERNISLPKVDK